MCSLLVRRKLQKFEKNSLHKYVIDDAGLAFSESMTSTVNAVPYIVNIASPLTFWEKYILFVYVRQI